MRHLTGTTRHDALTTAIADDIGADLAACPQAVVVLTRDPGLFNPWYVAVRWEVDSRAEAEAIANACLRSRPAYTAADHNGDGPCAAPTASCWNTDAGSSVLAVEATLDGVSGAPYTFVGREDPSPGNLRVRVVRISTPVGGAEPDHVDVYAINV